MLKIEVKNTASIGGRMFYSTGVSDCSVVTVLAWIVKVHGFERCIGEPFFLLADIKIFDQLLWFNSNVIRTTQKMFKIILQVN